MLQQPILSLFVRMIPESFLVLYFIFTLTNTKFNIKKTFILGVIAATVGYFIRLLPIHFGVHTILGIMVYIFLSSKAMRVDVYKAIVATLISQIILFICDFILVIIYTNVFGMSAEALFGQTRTAIISGIPSLILFYFVVLVIFYFRKKRTNND